MPRSRRAAGRGCASNPHHHRISVSVGPGVLPGRDLRALEKLAPPSFAPWGRGEVSISAGPGRDVA